jgi:hypothetical protein
MSSRLHPSPLLRRALAVDAVMGMPTAALGLLATTPAAQWLGLPPSLLVGSGAGIVAFTALLVTLLRSQTMSAALVRVVIAINAIWVLASVALAVSGLVQPNVWGEAFLVLNAVLPGVLGIFEWKGLRASSPAGPALAHA